MGSFCAFENSGNSCLIALAPSFQSKIYRIFQAYNAQSHCSTGTIQSSVAHSCQLLGSILWNRPSTALDSTVQSLPMQSFSSRSLRYLGFLHEQQTATLQLVNKGTSGGFTGLYDPGGICNAGYSHCELVWYKQVRLCPYVHSSRLWCAKQTQIEANKPLDGDISSLDWGKTIWLHHTNSLLYCPSYCTTRQNQQQDEVRYLLNSYRRPDDIVNLVTSSNTLLSETKMDWNGKWRETTKSRGGQDVPRLATVMDCRQSKKENRSTLIVLLRYEACKQAIWTH